MSFVKLYGTILSSSIWLEDDATRLVWITMLAMADQDGVVLASVGGLAHHARVERDRCLHALEVLSSPDADDRSGVAEGRRIEAIQGGWVLLNHGAYRERAMSGAERVRKSRAQRVTKNVTNSAESEADREADGRTQIQDPHSGSVEPSDADADRLIRELHDEAGLPIPDAPVLVHPSEKPKPKRARSKPEIDPRAKPVLDYLIQLRAELKLRPLSETETTDRCIVALLKNGVAVDQMLEVVAARADEVEDDPSQAEWFNAVSMFSGPGVGGRPGGWATSLRALDRRDARSRVRPKAPQYRGGPLDHVDDVLARREVR